MRGHKDGFRANVVWGEMHSATKRVNLMLHFRVFSHIWTIFIALFARRFAKRGVGRHAKQWISLEPGFVVYGDSYLVIEQHGAALH